MSEKLKEIVARAELWSDSDQRELAEYAAEIEHRRSGVYYATPEDIAAIHEAERSGVASIAAVASAFKAFRQ